VSCSTKQVLHTQVNLVDFETGSSSALSTATRWVDQWAASTPPATTPQWRAFFSLLQKYVLDRRPWSTREDLRIAIVTCNERTCHRRRRRAALGRMAPIEFETITTTPATQAARPSCHPFVQHALEIRGRCKL
jgi:hypothetical protein